MMELVLTSAEVDQIKVSDEPVVVKGPDGEVIAFFRPPRIPDAFDLAMIEKIKTRRDQPQVYRTYAQVKERLRQLEAGECAGK